MLSHIRFKSSAARIANQSDVKVHFLCQAVPFAQADYRMTLKCGEDSVGTIDNFGRRRCEGRHSQKQANAQDRQHLHGSNLPLGFYTLNTEALYRSETGRQASRAEKLHRRPSVSLVRMT